MSRNLVKHLSAKFNGTTVHDIEDAVQDAYVEALQQAKPVTAGFYLVASKNNLIDAKRKMRPQSVEETDENELSYDPADAWARKLDVKRVLEENFTPFERRIIYAYFIDGASTREIATLYPQRSQTTWHRWFEHTVRPLLCRELADYAEGAVNEDEEKEAG